ncbi:cupin domain-containing protein [Rhizobium fabae]|uniref:Mannose-6-phosphate isomerase-like protein (Cupin superfamily) n=1 Tax=Rhizobium fabae TaxID=573179 RepID=A0A7W6FM13_9HYPH|nr:cupin domain-containing protein [Rhizobium fabae]MBB3918712.1 mannose-6-phosphate isomerase-like protein (cupin superfamily) [Rhizobium fabae]
MTIRRVVLGQNSAGKAVVISDGPSPREMTLQHTPGFVSAPIWTTSEVPSVPYNGTDPMASGGTLLQPPGGSTFMLITFPPDEVFMSPDFKPELAGPEHAKAAPGIAETFELENPGMHKTPTLDYGVVLEGRITLELDDGATVDLKPGDTFVQQGARHAWRNPNDKPATIAVVLLGAR